MPSAYEAMLLQARKKELDILASKQRRITGVLLDTSRNITRLMQTLAYPDDVLKMSKLAELQRQVNVFAADFAGELQGTIVSGVSEAAKASSEGRMKAAVVYLNDVKPDMVNDVPRMYATIPRQAVETIFKRKYKDGRVFSQRIWNLRNYTSNVISDTVSQGMLMRKSAREIAQDLDRYLINPSGGVSPKAMTLARTEINHAFREASVISAKQAAWVKGLQWRLSSTHPVRMPEGDICDIWASQDIHGLGRGVYPPDGLPIDHPNGTCFTTDVLVSKEEFLELLKHAA